MWHLFMWFAIINGEPALVETFSDSESACIAYAEKQKPLYFKCKKDDEHGDFDI